MCPHTRDDALALLEEYTSSESLLKHSFAVEAAMRWYAEYFRENPADHPDAPRTAADVDLWGMTGLLHDFDYERFPEPEPPDGHPFMGNRILAERGYPESLTRAIMGHATYSGVPRDTLMAKALFAVDELSGLVMATTMVRPDRSLESLEAPSVVKRMKDKAFARGCNRDDIRIGAEELGIELPLHTHHVILALRTIAPRLGL
jgi:predicted hydrolase (HD superfamily)